MGKQKKEHGETKKSEDMRLPPVLSKSFWELLTRSAEEFGVTRAEMAIRALKYYVKELRIRKSPITEALDEDATKLHSQVQSTLSKNYWASLTAEERKNKTAAARNARWGNKKK